MDKINQNNKDSFQRLKDQFNSELSSGLWNIIVEDGIKYERINTDGYDSSIPAFVVKAFIEASKKESLKIADLGIDFIVQWFMKELSISYNRNNEKVLTLSYNPNEKACLENNSAKEDLREKVIDFVPAFKQIYTQFESALSEIERARLLSYITLARYEFELYAGSYIGGFTLPFEIVEKLPEGKYLEIALGIGDNLKNIAEVKNNSTFYGCDISRYMVETARRSLNRLNKNIEIIRSSADDLIYPPNNYDVIMMFNALDRIPNTKQALAEINRVSRDGAFVVIGNCIPLQNEKQIEGGATLTYVPKESRVESMEEAIAKTGCKLEAIYRKIPWQIETIIDGKELLYVDVAIGRK